MTTLTVTGITYLDGCMPLTGIAINSDGDEVNLIFNASGEASEQRVAQRKNHPADWRVRSSNESNATISCARSRLQTSAIAQIAPTAPHLPTCAGRGENLQICKVQVLDLDIES